MECAALSFSRHALVRMFQRGITVTEVREVIASGEVIESYPNDEPYPAALLLGSVGGRHLHVAVAREDQSGGCIAVTVYEPNPLLWNSDLKTRRR